MTTTPTGTEFAVYAGHARSVSLSHLDGAGLAHRVECAGPLHGWWHAALPTLPPGTPYVVHADGPWEPSAGLRYDPTLPLLDPYARAVDSQGRAVVIDDDAFDWGDEARPRRSWSETVIYEAHVRGMTMTHPAVPARLRGTYAGLAHPAVIAHLQRIGVTAIELLPIHLSVTEPSVAERGLSNYWGYNTLGFFAPNPRYAAASDPVDVVAEVKGMVKALHAAGIEVLLDVVYNHTAEQEMTRPAMSWRGLDNRAYYRLDAAGREIDVTGCGNTLDLSDPIACQLVLDSLRYWVETMHVDGFRFDLAVALARGKHGDYDPDHPFLVALRTDPLLRQVKMIAEPWDLGYDGWRTGQFPPGFAEWNDRFRDDVRSFWLSAVAAQRAHHPGHGVRDLATRISGSADLFAHRGRRPTASVNFVAAHDGFTTADLTAYDVKHNEANGEGNRDGASHNRSWNHGVEGASDDPEILAARRRAIRNLLGTLLLSTGVPMINAGDEFGRSQDGNNNAYCQDNELGWLDWRWQDWQEDLVAQIARLAQLRREHPALRQGRFFTGTPGPDGGQPDLSWFTADGEPMDEWHWHDPAMHTVVMLLAGTGDGEPDLVLVVNGSVEPVEVKLPAVPGIDGYRRLWDSATERPGDSATERPGEPRNEPGDEPGRADRAGWSERVDGASLQLWATR